MPRTALSSVSVGTLAEDLKAVWSIPTTNVRLKKRIVHTPISEATTNLDDETAEIVPILHLTDGVRTEHSFPLGSG